MGTASCILSLLFHVSFITTFVLRTVGYKYKIPVGLIIDKRHDVLERSIIKHIKQQNEINSYFEMETKVINLDTSDSYNVSRALCSLLSAGAITVIGDIRPSALETVIDYAQDTQIPFIFLNSPTISREWNESKKSMQIYMEPSLTKPIVAMIHGEYSWNKMYYFYDSMDAVSRIEQIQDLLHEFLYSSPDIQPHEVTTDTSCLNLLKHLYDTFKGEPLRIVLDVDPEKAKSVIDNVVANKSLLKVQFHFVLPYLSLRTIELDSFINGGINITGFEVFQEGKSLQYKRRNLKKIKTKEHMSADTANLLFQSLRMFQLSQGSTSVFGNVNGWQVTQESTCLPQLRWRWKYGRALARVFQNMSFVGRSGLIRFDSGGQRIDYSVDVQAVTMYRDITTMLVTRFTIPYIPQFHFHGVWFIKDRSRGFRTVVRELLWGRDWGPDHIYISKDSIGYTYPLQPTFIVETAQRLLHYVGKWHNDNFEPHGEEQVLDKANRTIDNRTRIVTSIDEEPYLQSSTEAVDGVPLVGYHRFFGYCSDLAEMVSRNVGYDYHIRFVIDGEYGRKQEDGTWNGVIGELIKHEADIAIAPLTITSDREKVLDFTKPFMNLGISLMIKKTADTGHRVFSFMEPLSQEIWLCTVFAFIGVSVVLFLVSRFSSEEWQLDADSKLENDFTIGNSLWFSLGAFMQQGCDVLPKSVSGRIVTSVWWFFTLIIISSYTANLAAFLTTMRMSGSIRSAEDLVKQTEIKYGPYKGGSTYMFFNQTTVPLYQRMWSFMNSQTDVFVKDNDEGIKRVRESNGQYVFLIESTLNEYYSSRLPCDTIKAGSNLDAKGYGIATPMGSDIRDKLTLSILQLREDGVLDELKKKWWIEKSQCPVEVTTKETDASLKLSKVAGIFYILVAGLGLSVISVILEFLYKTKVDSRKQNVSFGSEARSKFRLSISGHSEDDSIDQRTPLRSTTSMFTTANTPGDEESSVLHKTQTLV